MNIILVVIDTLRPDYISALGKNDWLKTPNFDRLAAQSLSFDRTYIGSYPTIPCRTDLITGRYGAPFHRWYPLSFETTTLPGLLADSGYVTQLIHDTPHLVNGGHAFDYPFHFWSFIRGAEVDRPVADDKGPAFPAHWKRDPLFDYLGDPEMKELWDAILVYAQANRNRKNDEDWNAAQLFTKAADFIRANASRDNFFLWLDSFDPHEPWDVPPEYMLMYDDTPGYDGRIDPRTFLNIPPPEDEAHRRAAFHRKKASYAAKVTWTDRWFGKVLDALEETGLDKNTAIILTSDHGCNAGDFGKFCKSWMLNEYEAHVPLLIRLPGLEPGRSDVICQPQDIFRTILGLGGARVPNECDGHNILDQVRGETEAVRPFAVAGMSPGKEWRDDPSKTLFSVFGDDFYLNVTLKSEMSRLFAYGTAEDVSVQHPDVVKSLRKLGLEEVAKRGMSPELVDWLRTEGEKPFPESCLEANDRGAWRMYWHNNYGKW